ncbi:putative zinc finger/helix-turn-helix protein%2C YgiT family [uncultured Clostridium sp.]|nr:putative zinc finger/helix-turn-helix protein%2C YgiT family [uncultured Clostridium sp.]SCJ45584.1 putative zinc finger/helix-turn-helix protein%2C YgiT family [uncultured Clostridium sp.]
MRKITFDKNLRNLRKMYGMSMSDLGKIINVSKQSISKYENGCYPSFHIVTSIAEYFNYSLDDLVYGDIESDPDKDSLKFLNFLDQKLDVLKKEVNLFNKEINLKIDDAKREIFKSVEIKDTNSK